MFKLKKTPRDNEEWIGTVFRYTDTDYTIESIVNDVFMLKGQMHLSIKTFYRDLELGKIKIVKDVSV